MRAVVDRTGFLSMINVQIFIQYFRSTEPFTRINDLYDNNRNHKKIKWTPAQTAPPAKNTSQFHLPTDSFFFYLQPPKFTKSLGKPKSGRQLYINQIFHYQQDFTSQRQIKGNHPSTIHKRECK